jgi:hypothetical protein
MKQTKIADIAFIQNESNASSMKEQENGLCYQ